MAKKPKRQQPVEYFIDDDGNRVPVSELSQWERDDLQAQQDMDEAGDLFYTGGDHE